MIGTIAFNLPWEDLADSLSEKFKQDNFVIHILRESETTIAQNSLMTLSQEGEGKFENLSRGNLVGIKEKTIRDLKAVLKEVTGGENIEPPEDIFTTELGNIFYTEKRKYLLRSYQLNNCLEQFIIYAEKCIRETVEREKNKFLGHPDFISAMSVNITKDPEFVSRYANDVEDVLEKAIARMIACIKDIQVLSDMSLPEDISGVSVYVNKKGQSIISMDLDLDSQGINISFTVEFDVEKWIDDFTLDSDKEEENYRLLADKMQAVKRATYLRKQKLEEYQRKPETKQRLFVKNCYMPIPVPMMKIDDELFITMALTQFDSIDKFQYVGKILFDD